MIFSSIFCLKDFSLLQKQVFQAKKMLVSMRPEVVQ